jgi:Fe-S cluster assembly protein SufB
MNHLPNKHIVEAISHYKNEPQWMLDFRLQALEVFQRKTLPSWGADLSDINFNEINYYIPFTQKKANTWEELPQKIRDTYKKLGIPQAEQRFLAGVNAQYDSEMIYQKLQKNWEKKGVIFIDTDTAIKRYPDHVKHYFGKIIPVADNTFSALNSAVWSGGSFIYVPKNVHIEIPLQAYFRINAERLGQFERTLIIADEGSFIHYIEGCTAPIYKTNSLHAGVVEIIVKKGARVRYTTIQNWSTNIYNLVTKRMVIEEEGIGEWIDGNIGSKVTMKYPSLILQGKGAKGNILSLAIAGKNQQQDAGGKAIHLAPFTTSTITSKSISMHGGRTSYRGKVLINNNASNSSSFVRCDALLLDNNSRSDTYPTSSIQGDKASFSHETTIAKIEKEQLFYLMSRGISEQQATSLIVNGFIEPIIQELPFEYAVELNRLISLSMEGAIG